VRKKANKLADILANQGVSCKDRKILMDWLAMSPSNLKELCHNQEEEDKEVYKNKTQESNSQ